jgi:hypothetical protein
VHRARLSALLGAIVREMALPAGRPAMFFEDSRRRSRAERHTHA